MSVDFDTHVMRMLVGLVGIGVLLLLALIAQLLGAFGWLVLIAIAGVYILGVLIIAVLDRIER